MLSRNMIREMYIITSIHRVVETFTYCYNKGKVSPPVTPTFQIQWMDFSVFIIYRLYHKIMIEQIEVSGTRIGTTFKIYYVQKIFLELLNVS